MKSPQQIHPSYLHNSSFVCRHNLQYWHSLPYLAFGAGAHGYANGYRYSNALRIKTYIEQTYQLSSFNVSITNFLLSPATVNHHKQTLQDDMSDYMINNLRLTNAGVAESDFRERFGIGLLDVYRKEIEELIRLGLLEKKTSEVFEDFGSLQADQTRQAVGKSSLRKVCLTQSKRPPSH